MGHDKFEVIVNIAKLLVIFLIMVQAVPVLVWAERRGSAFIQNRLGPNRVGPLGLLQLLADAVKFLWKEQFVPEHAIKFLFNSAPVIALVPAALAFAAIPLGPAIHIAPFMMMGESYGPYIFHMQSVDMSLGIVYILGVSSLGAYGLLAAGFGSGNKYSLLGALRASAQMISYELAMGLAILGVVMLYGTFNLTDIIDHQNGPMSFAWFGSQVSTHILPNWGIFYQPLGAVIFLTAAFAESNRLPFDLPESEGELVAGFHTEYGGFKMLLFFMGEYGHMMVASGLFAIFYLGGYSIPWVANEQVAAAMNTAVGAGNLANILTSLLFFVVFFTKIILFLVFFIQVRWTLPRFRYDHLMDLGWKTMLPWALGNAVLTTTVLYIMHR
jgi:NADH-quinone oxidoreductase subunit H